MINFCDLGLHHSSESKIWEAAKKLVSSNGYILGTEVNEFENSFAEYCESRHSVGVATGCDALLWAMEALGIGKGNEVITVANTFIGTVLPILRVGATPVLVDCDPITQQIDPEQVAAAITSRTSAIVPVHLYGRLAPMDELLAIAEKIAYICWKMRLKPTVPDIKVRGLAASAKLLGLVFIQPKT
jgi:dTDP-4-amino-4,6-dideoxygalactose transaminase